MQCSKEKMTVGEVLLMSTKLLKRVVKVPKVFVALVLLKEINSQ